MKIPTFALRALAIGLCALPIHALAQSPGGAAAGLPSAAPTSPPWPTSAIVASTVAAGIALGLIARTSSNH